MTKQILLAALALLPAAAFAQGAFDAYSLSQPDLKGTARFMSMGGAFGALGGDLSTFSQNPAGIGVYRRSEIGITVDLDCQSSKAESFGLTNTTTQTKFLLNNFGGVATYRLNSETCPNINFGFSYNKAASFNRHFGGRVPTLFNSLSNYIAGVTNQEGATVGDLETTDNYDPYNPNDGGYVPQWASILGYDSYLITPQGDNDSPTWVGQWGSGTSGVGNFETFEKGGIDEYNITLGGNISNVVFWGMDFGITDLNYRIETLWGEQLQNAYVDNQGGVAANWDLYNNYRMRGTGFTYRLGLIVKPVQELRLGFAIHTPTWYNIDEEYYGDVNYNYTGENMPRPGYATTNNGYTATNSYNFRSPWKFLASIAGIIGERMILSADYEWTSYSTMKFSEDTREYYYDDDPWYWENGMAKQTRSSIDYNSPYGYTNYDISNYFTKTSTLRLGAEFRVTPQFSVRAGYSYVSSPVKSSVADNMETVYTTGTRPQYVVDKSTNYVTCGLGYRYQKFYIDAAYVWKHRTSDYHAYTPDPANPNIPSPQATITDSNSQIVLSMGFKF